MPDVGRLDHCYKTLTELLREHRDEDASDLLNALEWNALMSARKIVHDRKMRLKHGSDYAARRKLN